MATPMILAGEAVAAGPVHTLRAPWDDRPLGEIHMAGPDQIEAALAGATRGFAQTRVLPAWRRAEILDHMATGLAARAEEATAMIRDEVGKPQGLAAGEVQRAITTLRFGAWEAKRGRGELIPMDAVAAGTGRTGIIERFPAGPVVAIAPFNFPLNLVVHKVAPAIAAGCSFVIKPPEQSPSPSLLLAELALEAGYPAEAVNVVPAWREVADALVTDPRTAVLSFTGSAPVGWSMKARAGRKKVVLELGGNAAAIVHADADLALAVDRLAVGAFAYAGQVCISVQRVLVHRSIWEPFLDAFAARVQAVGFGDPTAAGVISGPMIDDRQADRVQAWTREAVGRGARMLVGGGREGRTLAPTLLSGVDRALPLYQEEVFGPVVMAEPYGELDEAIARVNDSRWGLQVGVFTREVSTVFKCFHEIEVGGVIHDDFPTFRVDHMPYGGIKDSGLGREGLRWAVEDYTEPRLLVLRA